MDIFLEQMIKRKRTIGDLFKVLLCVVCAFAIFWVLPVILILPMVGSILLAVCVLAIYFLYRLVCTINLEYEYTFTNGMMDVDKIINRKSRKSMVEVNIRKIEIAGKKENSTFSKYMADGGIKKIYACSQKNAEDLGFIVFQDKDGKNKMLLFNPNEELQEAIRRFNPQKVFFQ